MNGSIFELRDLMLAALLTEDFTRAGMAPAVSVRTWGGRFKQVAIRPSAVELSLPEEDTARLIASDVAREALVEHVRSLLAMREERRASRQRMPLDEEPKPKRRRAVNFDSLKTSKKERAAIRLLDKLLAETE